jgi:hypothetical protein
MANAHLYVAVREAAAGTFDVLGELGTVATGGVVYLAREISSTELVVLKLEPGDDGAGGAQYFLDVMRELDASVPDVEMRCPRCRAKLRQWARFCTQCGLDVSGEAPASGEFASRAALREKVRAATAGQYEFLGDIPRSEGGGLVYFARDLTDGKIVALRLQKDMNKKFEVGVTRTLKAVEREDAAAAKGAASARPAVTIIQRTPLGATRRLTPSQPAAPAAGSAPNVASGASAGRRWKFGRVEIGAAIAVALIIILILMRLSG